RHLLYLGLTQDEAGRQVFDGVIPHIAGARRGEFNQRFGQPSLNATCSTGSLFPFTDASALDRATGKRGALLARLEARDVVPKIVSVNTAAEYWRGDASVVHSDVEGTRDVEPPPHARLYLFPGCQHPPGALPPPDADPNTGSRGRHTFNVVDYSPLLRAVLVNLDRWVTDGVEPPPSAVPRLADGTGVAAETTRETFTRIPGAGFPDRIERPRRFAFRPGPGPGSLYQLSPKTGRAKRGLLPASAGDSNRAAR